MTAKLSRARTATLEIAYEESGPPDGMPVFLMHGFPYDVRTYDAVVPRLVAAGCRTVVPYLRGYGPTRFLFPDTPRSGQQAAPEQEHALWYQYYFHTERGRAGLAANRHAFCKLIWRLWSPNRQFDDATYDRTAVSFDNPDFVEVVIQSYRHRFGTAAGDPALEAIEQRLAARPRITVPTIVLHGAGNGLSKPESSMRHAPMFTGRYRHRVIPVAGHNLPAEVPKDFAEAVLELTSGRPRASGDP